MQSSIRNQRSKGFKVKHALQIFLLVAVCFWLIYQVKHSHDKKKHYDDNDARISQNRQTHDEILKLGRNNLHPQVNELSNRNERHEEEAEEVEIKAEVKEDEIRGGVNEVDEHDQQKSYSELDREEEFVDEEKELEGVDEKKTGEKEVTDKDSKTDIESSVDNLYHDRETKNTHEAREEQYKADDASSAVTHEGQTISSESESGSTQNQTNIFGNENKSNNTIESNIGQNVTDSKVHEEETAENGTSFLVNPEKGSEVLRSTFQGSTFLNSTVTTESTDQLKSSNYTAEVSKEFRDLLNGTEIGTLDPSHARNDTEEPKSSSAGSNNQTASVEHANNSSIAMFSNQFDSKSTDSISTVNVESNLGALLNFSDNQIVSEHTAPSNASAETKDGSEINVLEENRDADQKEKSDLIVGADGNYGGSNSSNTENASKLQNETVDSITMEDNLPQLDLETLPNVRMETSNSEETAEEIA